MLAEVHAPKGSQLFNYIFWFFVLGKTLGTWESLRLTCSERLVGHPPVASPLPPWNPPQPQPSPYHVGVCGLGSLLFLVYFVYSFYAIPVVISSLHSLLYLLRNSPYFLA